ncbi:MAG: hypothetical protein JRJ85_17665 [Deltaproteobacteria bacterium]|nr:hypothetical protein [Deltaproteobacteria bacterium]
MSWELKRHPMYHGEVKQTYPNIAAGEPALSKAVVVGNVVFLYGMTG